MIPNIHIVGFGVAGACIALRLRQAGIPFRVSDMSATIPGGWMVNGGLINPISGQRATLPWQYSSYGPSVRRFYEYAARTVGNIALDVTIRRRWANASVAEYYRSRLAAGEYADVQVITLDEGLYDGVTFPHGGADILHSIRVEVPSFIPALRNLLEREGVHFEGTEPRIDDAETTIWATGHHITSHHLWSHIPLHPSKGEVLEGYIEGWTANYVLSGTVSVIPLGGGRYRVGSTHVWDDITEAPTQAGRQWLEAALLEMTRCEMQVERHAAGIRPANQERRPMVARHPERSQHLVVTGLGAKGMYYAPWCADRVLEMVIGES